MRIYANTLSGPSISLDVEPSDTINIVMEKIYDQEGIPVEQQRLIYAGKMLESGQGKTLESYGITANARIHLVLRLRNG